MNFKLIPVGYIGPDHKYFVEDNDDRQIAIFTLRRINKALCWACNLKIHFPGQGYYKHVHALKIAEAQRLGFTMMLASVGTSNKAELRCIDKYGWKRIGGAKGRDNPRLILASYDLVGTPVQRLRQITEQDASEIFYALDSKRLSILNGDYGDRDPDVDPADWAEHLNKIMGKIGPDGECLVGLEFEGEGCNDE